MLGALGAVALRGLDDNIYVQIGLVLLIGLSAKNSILIVEFAEQIRAQGKIHRRCRDPCRLNFVCVPS